MRSDPCLGPTGGRAGVDGCRKTVDDFITIGQEAFNDDDSPAASMPFPHIGGKAEYVQVGRPVDEQVLEVEKAALEAFARGVNFPAQLLTVGPGRRTIGTSGSCRKCSTRWAWPRSCGPCAMP